MGDHRSDYYIPGLTDYPEDYEDYEDYGYRESLYEETDEHFHIGQCYENTPAQKIVCKTCKSDKFEVATGNHYTAIRCPTCGWENCIHDG